ncbi:unnamed protein product [Medioppia subpectinata]|uniref:Uncharacterized protein n=1 Tax=Medioppia subpectinata TaxID=1979941 RepID=A0A7R9KPA1_9ACAR|nr:unnamed protein product [Medioppia subpectinata]CAG2107276.1 unnamed protein product [Medioppia subpectinata]
MYPFSRLVELARHREMTQIKRIALLRAVNMALYFVSGKLLAFLCLVAFVLNGGTITAPLVFVTITLFNNARTSLTLYFPNGVAQGSEALVSIKRLQEFLLLEEKELNLKYIDKYETSSDGTDVVGVWLDAVTASWALDQHSEPTLHDISFSVSAGQLIAIVGAVGSGKSSLLLSVLTEMPVLSGNLKVRGKISYASQHIHSQQSWSFSGTVRENVLFGGVYNEEKYRKVLHVCALQKDLQLFPNGDATVVGERGVSLSGGQKARINLARALYREADIYLLDDPLSTVDTAVAKHIYEKCIRGYLRDKTVLLVTHQLQYIADAQQIVVLREGRQQAIGTYQELVNLGIDFINTCGEKKEDKCLDTTKVAKNNPKRQVSGTGCEHTAQGDYELREDNHIVGEKPQINASGGEQQTMGSVTAGVYWLYARSGAGILTLTIIIGANVLTQLLFNGSDYLLSLWTDSEQHLYQHEWVRGLSRRAMIITFGALMAGLLTVSLIRTALFFSSCMGASVTLHNRLFNSLMRAPIAFIDDRPIGVLLNRFARDMGLVDDLLPVTAFDALQIGVQLVGAVAITAWVAPITLAPTAALAVIFHVLRRYYIPSARAVKRLEASARSPLYSQLSNTMHGLATVRGFGTETTCADTFDGLQDRHTGAWFMFLSAIRWFGIALDVLCWLYVGSVTGYMTAQSDNPSMTASAVGLTVSTALSLSGVFQWGVRQSAELESQMTSVERVDEYSHVAPEPNLETGLDVRPLPEGWPREGVIEFRDVTLKYSPSDPPVLKNLNVCINSGEKVGIVGRTGAGKSSLIAALFRLTPPTAGAVLIDGVDTGAVSLADLRGGLSIIPQDPVLFAGTVRLNMDPSGDYGDNRLWEALDAVCLKERVMLMAGALDARVSEGGDNFSVGQRQLLCLARALLRHNRILVLDEPTANVDPGTDELIQATIRNRFAACTVLIIAHRLHTIMDSDRVLVLDSGHAVEFDEPYALLADESGLFSGLVRTTGTGMARKLTEMAKIAYNKRHNMDTDVSDSERPLSYDFEAGIETNDECIT